MSERARLPNRHQCIHHRLRNDCCSCREHRCHWGGSTPGSNFHKTDLCILVDSCTALWAGHCYPQKWLNHKQLHSKLMTLFHYPVQWWEWSPVVPELGGRHLAGGLNHPALTARGSAVWRFSDSFMLSTRSGHSTVILYVLPTHMSGILYILLIYVVVWAM